MWSRRQLLTRGAAAWLAPTLRAQQPSALAALLPRDASGRQFVIYADSCAGIPGSDRSRNFDAVNQMLQRLSPAPEFICFPGDHISGGIDDYVELRRRWDYWLNHQARWMRDRDIPAYHTTSNHNTYDRQSEAVWREVFPDIPTNGPDDQKGLSYWVRRGNLLLVCVNTSFSGLGGYGHVESAWLERVLQQNSDAEFKFVAGHHPVFPVNGFGRYPLWRIVPEQGAAFWSVLSRHDVLAYLCSHIIAFDVQTHEGVLQLTTGGAGTIAGPGGAMPGRTEYLHAVQMAVDRQGLRYQVLDAAGKAREHLEWPLRLPETDSWDDGPPVDAAGKKLRDVVAWRIKAVAPASASESQTLLCGWDDQETVAHIWIGLEGWPSRVIVRLLAEPGGGEQTWRGPTVAAGQEFDIQIALHTGMGPGGILWRWNSGDAWSSMKSNAASGAERLVSPAQWSLGYSQSGATDTPFLGSGLSVAWCSQAAT